MGLKALVDYSLIKELCEGKIKCSKHNFTGKISSTVTTDETKTENKVNKIKRLLLSDDREKAKKNKRSKKSPKISPKKSKSFSVTSHKEYYSNSSDESTSDISEEFPDARKSEQSGTSESGSSSEVSELGE